MTSPRLISGVLMVSLVLVGCELSIGTKKTQEKMDNVARTYNRDRKLVSEVTMSTEEVLVMSSTSLLCMSGLVAIAFYGR